MSHFMRCELTQAAYCHLFHLLRCGFSVFVWSKQAFCNKEVLTYAKRTQVDMSLHDFTGTWIRDRSAVRPSAGRAMHPVDQIVAYVHRVGAFRENLHPKCILIAGGFKGLVP